MTNELAVIEQETNPATLFHRATDVAGVCGEIVKRTARFIQGRKYVQVEGWQSIAASYGCIASSTKVEKVEGGVRAIGELRRISDGALLATAEGFVGEDEPTWYGGESRGKTLPKRAEYAIRAMAQTRAISRVCRTAFAFVVVLIDSKLATTPAEEMPYDEDKGESIPTESAAPEESNGSKPTGIQSALAAAAPITRSETFKRMCAEAGFNAIDMLAKAGCSNAEEMSEEDWASFQSLYNRKMSKARAA